MRLPWITSLASKVLIIRDRAVCPSPLCWQLRMSYVKKTGCCFLQRSCTLSQRLCMWCYSSSQCLQKVGDCPRGTETNNDGNITVHLGIFINESCKLRIYNWIPFLTVLISVMLITAAAGHLMTHKREQKQTRGEQNVTALQVALSITGFHLLSSRRNAKVGALEPGKLLLNKRIVISTVEPAESTWSGCQVSWGHHFSRQGHQMCQLIMAVREGNTTRENGERGKGSNTTKWCMLGGKGGWRPALRTEAWPYEMEDECS